MTKLYLEMTVLDYHFPSTVLQIVRMKLEKGSLFQYNIVLGMACKEPLLELNIEKSLQRILLLKI